MKPNPLIPPPLDSTLKGLIQMAVREDLGQGAGGFSEGDKTVELAIPRELRGVATVVARRPGILSGAFLIDAILQEYGGGVECVVMTPDGARASPSSDGKTQPVATLSGPVRTMLSAERVLLNFMGHLSGIATLTRQYVDVVAAAVGDPAKRPAICDTRKTTPGWRMLDKYAVRCGGGTNHRMGLYDGVMLKDNHLAALREKLGHGLTLAELTARIRADLDRKIMLWLEVDTLAQFAEALPGGGADIILLDNFTPEQMREAVRLRDGARSKILLESSGGVTLDTLGAIAQTGVDRISIGALTHSAPVLDLSMEMA